MIKLTKLNGKPLFLNPMIIESIEIVPDTVITLTNGKTVVVQDTIEYITEAAIDFYSRFGIFSPDYYGGDDENSK